MTKWREGKDKKKEENQIYERKSVQPKQVLNKDLDNMNTNMLSRMRTVCVKGKMLRNDAKVSFGRSPTKRDGYDSSWPFESHPQR